MYLKHSPVFHFSVKKKQGKQGVRGMRGGEIKLKNEAWEIKNRQ